MSIDLHKQLPSQALELASALDKKGFTTWAVGGSLRDVLRGESVSDWDFATDAEPAQVQKIFKRSIPTGIQHGTITVLIGDRSFEVTTLRGEGAYSDGRRPDEVHFVKSIEEDLRRRDFTVNAMAYNLKTKALIDPFHGQIDLKQKLLRAVDDPVTRFTEDGLRIMRAARFAATLEFAIEANTQAALAKTVAMLCKVSKERIRDELSKMLLARIPSKGLTVMKECGAIELLLPDLAKTIDCTQGSKHHLYDVWQHTLHCVDAARADLTLRLTMLFHDIAKPVTKKVEGEKVSFHRHEWLGAQSTRAILSRFRFTTKQCTDVSHLVEHHLVMYDPSWSDAAIRRFIKRVGAEYLDLLFEVVRADNLGKGVPVDDVLQHITELEKRVHDELRQHGALTLKSLAIDGADIIKHLGIKPGPIVGKLLEHLLDKVVEDPTLNERDTLLSIIENIDHAQLD